MTDIEEQIQEALKSTGVLRFPGDRFSLTAAVMPLVKRAQAEAWDKGWETAIDQVPGDAWFDEWDYQLNPYIESEATDV